MKKLLTLAIVFSLAFVLNSVSFAQDANAPAEAPMTIENVIEGEVEVVGTADAYGPMVPCPPCMPYAAPCRPFFRRHCMPAYAAPCGPQPYCGQVAPCGPKPFCGAPMRRGLCNKAPFYGAPCADPCMAGPCGDPCMAGPCGDSCGYPGYGYPGYCRTPIRNFFSRIFAPRAYCGYDAFYGPGGFGYGAPGCGPCGY